MSIDEGFVTAYGTSSKGKPTVTIDGRLYYLGKTKLTAAVGERISFEAHAFSDDGKLWSLDKWGKLPSNGTGLQQAGLPPSYAQMTPTNTPKVWDETVPRSLASDDATLRFISNCVGQAIAAKTIVDPTDIEIWVSAARNALKAQQ